MTVEDLIKMLSKVDKNTKVVVYDNGCWGEPTLTITPNMVFIESMED